MRILLRTLVETSRSGGEHSRSAGGDDAGVGERDAPAMSTWAPAVSASSRTLAVVALGLSSCTLLVSPEDLDIKCQTVQGEQDPCSIEQGLVCRSGTCQKCADMPEQCNGEDDDCDGEIDETFDGDGDGYTTCAAKDQAVDCNDGDPAIYPGADESCDGVDNDCSGTPDDSPECEEPGEPRCEPADPDSCPEGQQCNPETGRCFTPSDTGVTCNDDGDCASGICVDPEPAGLQAFRDESFCTTACCTETDCSEGDICRFAENGIRVCVPPSLLGRDATRKAGERCSQDEQCGSGVCEDGVCLKACASEGDCASADEHCAPHFPINDLSMGWLGPDQFVCSSQASIARSLLCPPELCPSGLCIGDSCGVLCGSNADCSEEVGLPVCSYANVGFPRSFRVSICAPERQTDATEMLCCQNDHCPEGQTCRPDMRDREWGMYCMQ